MMQYAEALSKLGMVRKTKVGFWEKHGGTILIAIINVIGIVVVAIISRLL